MKTIDYLPLGSVVILKGGIQELLIISRGINVKRNDEVLFFDYGGVLYPEGLLGDQMAYFNHDGIETVVFEGYNDNKSKVLAENINRYLMKNPQIKKGNPEEINK